MEEMSEITTLLERRKSAKTFEAYARTNLRIRTKGGQVTPFNLNTAQCYLDQRLSEQRARTGRVRALTLKARQQGISTYIEGRFYWLTSRTSGIRAFILAHEQEATNNLFDIANRYHENDPDAPVAKSANAKELDFAELDSGYRVATAGTKAVGRSQTIQFFHGSEVGFWPNAQEHAGGVLQAVPDLEGTEVILESTANGVGGLFHSMWQEAEAGLSEYEAIFIPWFWQEEYRKPVPNGFILTEEEVEYRNQYKITDEQIVWRRAKIAELRSEALFRQEYPATSAEAFQVSAEDSFIKPEAVVRARKAEFEALGPLVIGADPARYGDDRFSVAYRRGRKVFKIESKSKIDVVAGANWLRVIIDKEKPARMFVDAGGLGAGTVDILHSWGEPYVDIVVAVNFGGAPMEPVITLDDGTRKPGPKNRRAEMWMNMRDWLDDEAGADIPDSDILHTDLCGPHYRYDANQRLLLESKDEMRARGLRSPDEGDSIALTFAEPVYEKKPRKPGGVVGGWMG